MSLVTPIRKSLGLLLAVVCVAGCQARSELLDDSIATAAAVPKPDASGNWYQYTLDVRASGRDVARRWFPEGMDAREAERTLREQGFGDILVDATWISGVHGRCRPISCKGAIVDLKIENGKVAEAAVSPTWSNIFSF